MSLEDGLQMILKAHEKKEEDRAWQLYLMRYQHMTEKNFKSFEEFYQPQRQQQVNEQQSVDEILKDVKSILNMNRR